MSRPRWRPPCAGSAYRSSRLTSAPLGSQYGIGVATASGIASTRASFGCWRIVTEKRTSSARQTARRLVVEAAVGAHRELPARPGVAHPRHRLKNGPPGGVGAALAQLIHRRSWPTRAEARQAIFEFIEVFYNRQRLHSSLGYLSPAEYEAAKAHQPKTALAA